jgi:putative Mg2+ transporter-C (MgtC) family protein
MNALQSWIDALQATLASDFHDFADPDRMVPTIIRLAYAALLGGLLGYQRTSAGKAAGLRTHMLVTAGSALFILIPRLEVMPASDMGRVIQGIVTGIGFLGGGAILKLKDDQEIHGLTTAAGIWLASAIGIAVGYGRLGTATIGTLLALLILGVLWRIERRIEQRDTPG